MAKGQTASGTSVRELERCQRGHRDVDSRHRFPSGGVTPLTSAAPRMPHLGPARPKLCPGPAAAKWTVRKSSQATPEGWAQVYRGARGRGMDILTPGRPFEVQEASPSAKEMPRLQGQRQALFRVPFPPSTFQQEASRVMMGDSHGSAGSCLTMPYHALPILCLTTYSARPFFPLGSLPTLLALPAIPPNTVLSPPDPICSVTELTLTGYLPGPERWSVRDGPHPSWPILPRGSPPPPAHVPHLTLHSAFLILGESVHLLIWVPVPSMGSGTEQMLGQCLPTGCSRDLR